MEIGNELQSMMRKLRDSVTVKLVFIGILILVLLIPSSLVDNLIAERAQRQADMMADVSDKWSGSQLIQGPVLVIPYTRTVSENINGTSITKNLVENIYLLPNQLNINANIKAETLHRGIFEAVVYNSKISISGNFLKAELEKLNILPQQLIPQKAKITFNITDLKGLTTNPVINIAGQTTATEPAMSDRSLFTNGLQSAVNLTGLTDKTIPFNFILDVKGSQSLSFLHLGKTTSLNVKSNWASPSFDGRSLPDTRIVTKSGFSAKWHMLYYNRPFSQQWAADGNALNMMGTHKEAIVGVKLKIPVDQYQQTTRTSKYAILIIFLTFISLFFTELIGKQKIHVFNYLLIGAAMVIYYVLLLSFSEQIGYTPAYIVASVATVTLISVFIKSILKNTKAALLLSCILTIFYVFIYIIIQLEDFALLVGSLALFIIVALLMYFSRKIDWENH